MTAYAFGILLGILIGIIILIVTRKKGKREYDERQMAGRGIAFQNGFFTLLILDAICTVGNMLGDLPGEAYIWHFCSMMIGVGVYALTAIHYDAYLGLRENPKKFMIGGIFLAIGTFCSGIGNLHSNNSNYIISFAVSLLWIIILIAMVIHNRREMDE